MRSFPVGPTRAHPLGTPEMLAFLHGRVLIPAFESGLKRRKTFNYWRRLEASQWLPVAELQVRQAEALGRRQALRRRVREEAVADHVTAVRAGRVPELRGRDERRQAESEAVVVDQPQQLRLEDRDAGIGVRQEERVSVLVGQRLDGRRDGIDAGRAAARVAGGERAQRRYPESENHPPHRSGSIVHPPL